MSFVTHKLKTGQKNKKKPPPRPPPPNFSKYKSKSSFNLNQNGENLIEWSPPHSPTVEINHTFGGSVSSSFSSSTSSLASSKKSFEYEVPVTNNLWPVSFNNSQINNMKQYNNPSSQVSFYGKPNSPLSSLPNKVGPPRPNHAPKSLPVQVGLLKQNNMPKINIPPIFGPTIIRAQASKNKTNDQKINDTESVSPPMPCVPPPSPPKEAQDINISYGIALYDYSGTEPSDLSFQANDVIILLRRINKEWLYGRVLDKEGMFPANFVDVQVPLYEDDHMVTALYEFVPQMPGDLRLKPGQLVKVIRQISDDWYYGESSGQFGQFPINFVDRTPNL